MIVVPKSDNSKETVCKYGYRRQVPGSKGFADAGGNHNDNYHTFGTGF